MHDDVECRRSEIARESRCESIDGEVAELLVALVRPNVLGRVAKRVERSVERVDAFELEPRTVAQAPRLIELPALDQPQDMSLPRFLQFITHRGGKSAGAIRVSVGLASTFGDVQRFIEFAASFREQTRLSIGTTSFDIASCRIIRDGS